MKQASLSISKKIIGIPSRDCWESYITAVLPHKEPENSLHVSTPQARNSSMLGTLENGPLLPQETTARANKIHRSQGGGGARPSARRGPGRQGEQEGGGLAGREDRRTGSEGRGEGSGGQGAGGREGRESRG